MNSYPATAIEYGIETFASEVFGAGAKADFAVAGVNVGGMYNYTQAFCRSRLVECLRLSGSQPWFDDANIWNCVSLFINYLLIG